MRKKKGERWLDLSINVMLIIVAMISIYPIWYVLIASVSDPTAIAAGQVTIIPKGFNLQAYKKLFQNSMIWTGYKNSIIYTTAATLVDLFVQATCAFALSRKTLPGRKFLSTLFIIIMYFSGGMIPRFIIISKLGMLNSPLALIIPGCVSVYNIILLRNFFEYNIPDSLIEAAQIDGASWTKCFIKVVLPLSTAIIATVALFSITSHWNAYLGAQMYLYDSELYTLQQVIKIITSEASSVVSENATLDEMRQMILERNLMKYAVVVVGSIPLIIAYPFVQKHFVGGVMVGAVKG